MQIIEEAGKVYISGLLTEADVRNGNGRLYPNQILKPAVLDLQRRVLNQPQVIYAEREHPNRFEINPELACGLLVEVVWNDVQKNARCKVEVLATTEAGRKLLQDIKDGKKVGISTRGRGSLDENKVIQKIEFSTADIVSVPSCQNCWLSESTGEMMSNDFLIDFDIMELEEKKLESTLEEIQLVQAFEKLNH